MRLLIIDPSFGRQLIEIGEGGSYNDPERVLWDERMDGPLPDADIGGLTRINGNLFYDKDVALEDAAMKTSIAKVQGNDKILAALAQIDAKSIRALREGNQERISALEDQAAELRAQLVKV
jgi:hypothetical protein